MRENPWLQLQGRQWVLLNVRDAQSDRVPVTRSARHSTDRKALSIFLMRGRPAIKIYQRVALSHLALQLPCVRFSDSMGNHDSNIVDAGSVD